MVHKKCDEYEPRWCYSGSMHVVVAYIVGITSRFGAWSLHAWVLTRMFAVVSCNEWVYAVAGVVRASSAEFAM